MSKRILIVEDDVDLRETLRDVLVAEGWEVCGAGTLQEARQIVSERHPPVCLIDVALPDGFGTDLIPELREQVPPSGCVVVAGQPDVDSAIAALDMGAEAYLRKPLQPAELLHSLERIWDSRELRIKQRAAQEALQASEARYRLLAETSTDLISLHASDGTFLYASPASRELLGEPPEALEGRRLFDFAHWEDRDGLTATVREARSNPAGAVATYRVRRSTGEFFWAESSLRIVEETGSDTMRFSASTRDVSIRKRYALDLERARDAAER
ncbi:MAG: response regulator, partial [Myxococcota bacterium]